MKEELINEVRSVFGDVPFPRHCGLRAAMLRDDWVSDPEVLKSVTAEKDVKGSWWQIPDEELQDGSLFLSYLDSVTTEFYLPAYMCLIVNSPVYKNYSPVIYWLNPLVYDSEKEKDLLDSFHEQFSLLTPDRKGVCRRFFKYLIDEMELRGNDQMKLADDLKAMLDHEFWQA